MIYSRFAGTGSYLPSKIMTNFDLEKIVETSHDWIVERTGIKQRHIATDSDTSGYMAFQAAQRALDAAGMKAEQIDLIISATSTPDNIMPSTACCVQQLLGINKIPAFDLSAACAGFTYAVSIADQFIRLGTYKTVLVIGVEVMSRILDWNDRATCILFGDGAGAAILTADNQPGVKMTKLHAAGQYKDLLGASQAYKLDGTPQKPEVFMQGSEVFKVAVNSLIDVADEILTATNVSIDQVDWLVPHQANLRIIQAVAKKLAFPSEKIVLTVQDHGNTSSASIPLALDVAIRDGRIKRGQQILLESFGAGFTWGSVLFTF